LAKDSERRRLVFVFLDFQVVKSENTYENKEKGKCHVKITHICPPLLYPKRAMAIKAHAIKAAYQLAATIAPASTPILSQ
jgi:hypothetical protein